MTTTGKQGAMDKTEMEGVFMRHFSETLRAFGNNIAEELIAQGQQLLEKNMRAQVARMAIEIAQQSLVEKVGNELVIRVKFDHEKITWIPPKAEAKCSCGVNHNEMCEAHGEGVTT